MLVKLTRLSITKCQWIEEIIAKEGEDVESEIVFMKLESLRLEGLPTCKSFCCHNYTFKFPSLNKVVIKGCPKLRIFCKRFCSQNYAFKFPSLNKVIIKECPRLRIFCPGSLTMPSIKSVKEMDNEMHWHINLNEIIQQYQKNSSLHSTGLKIYERAKLNPELIDIWNGRVVIPNHSFRNLRRLVVDKCPFLSNHVIPSYILTSLINLNELMVTNCDSVEVVFDLEGINIDKDKEANTLQAIPLWNLVLMHLPKLKCVWNEDPLIDCFQHLCQISAYECETLTSIFPASIAKGLTGLEMLEIKSCGVEVIVAEGQIPAPIIHFEFSQLCFLRLMKLSNLKNFYPQKHTVEWSQLSFMQVRHCNKLKVFSWEVPEKTEEDAEDRVENQYPLLSLEMVPNLRSLALNQNDVKMISNGQFHDGLLNKVE